jgi:hypothetical protein
VLEGALIFRTPISDLLCSPFTLPPHWPQVYALDVNWRRASAVWGAWDFDSDTLYLHHEYSTARAELGLHAAEIKALGDSTLGLFDPLAHGRDRNDGSTLTDQLRGHDLDVFALEATEEQAFIEFAERAGTERLRVFDTLDGWGRNTAPIDATRKADRTMTTRH